MRRLTGLHADETGGMATLVGVLVVVVFMGFAAVVIDSGAAFFERRELQNGADAAALAIAYACARDEAECGTPTPVAEALANDNASDAFADVTGIDVDLGNERVTVDTQSLAGDGTSTFFQQLPGLLGLDPTTVVASATASWAENPSQLETLPLALSACEYDVYTADGAGLDSGVRVSIRLLGGAQGGAEDCEAPAGGAVLEEGEFMEGSFRWLNTDAECRTLTTLDDWVGSDQGISPPDGSCDDAFAAMIGSVIEFPIYDDMCKSGGGGYVNCSTVGLGSAPKGYHLYDFVGFELTGIKAPSINLGDSTCDPSVNFCINGYFRSTVAPGPPGGVGVGGVSSVRMTE